jgi:cobalamin biosynthesis Mg chelatase CobN
MRRYYILRGKYTYPLPWGELLIAILLLCLCSCKTKKVVTDEAVKERVKSEVSVLNEVAKVDTSMTTAISEVEEVKVVEEEVRTVKYDEAGRVTEETTIKRRTGTTSKENYERTTSETTSETERIEQDIDVEAERSRHTDTTEQTEPGPSTFWKWLGFGIGIAVLIAILRVFNKFGR